MIKVSYVVGVCVEHDAISASVLQEVEWLRGTGHHDVRIFTYACAEGINGVTIVNSTHQVVCDPHFQNSELVIYHFGIYSPLLDSAFFTPQKARSICVFHNITPANLLPEGSQEIIEKSYAQLGHMRHFDLVISDSGVNRDVLLDSGYTGSAVVVPLPISSSLSAPIHKPSQTDGIIRIGFVGRFVKSKGIDELTEIVSRLAKSFPDQKFSFRLIGNEHFSDQTYVTRVKMMEADAKATGSNLDVRVSFNAPNSEKEDMLRDADIFCLPSYHEGYCVPVLEALAAGCQVITYDNSNLKYIGGNLSHLVATGDHDAFYQRLRDVVEPMMPGSPSSFDYEGHASRATSYVASFSPEMVRLTFLRHVVE